MSNEARDDAGIIHRQALVIDGHCDTAQRFADEGWNFSDAVGDGMLSLDTALAGGLSAEFFAIWPEPVEWRGRYRERALRLIDAVHEQVRRHPATMRLGTSAKDIRESHRDGVFCALLGIEGGHTIENDLTNLRMFYRLGVRYMTLTWSNTNEWADSSGDLDDASFVHHGGLTDFGRTVVREMNRLGMMVDVSHVADTTFWDVLQTTHAPVIASHSSARTLTDSPRNLTDEQLQAIATNNGIVMVNFYPAFLSDAWRTAWAATHDEREELYAEDAKPYRERGEPVPYSAMLEVDRRFYAERLSGRLPLVPISALIDHIDHIVKMAGIDHVGLGSDFDGFAILPEGLRSAADLPKLTAALHERGYSAEQLKKLLGENLLRVFSQVQTESATE